MKLFQREQRSLFGEILDWMLTPLLLLWPISLVLTWFVAQTAAGKPFDQALEINVGELAALVHTHQGQLQFDLPMPARKLLRASESETIYYQVMGPGGELISGERHLPPPPQGEQPRFGQVRLRDDHYQGEGLRVAYKWLETDLPLAGPVLVQVAETQDKRAALATEIVKGVMLQQFIILPLAVLLVWLGLAYAIKPLNQLEERIRARKPDDLSPLDDQSVPQEVAPLVLSVNDLLQRLTKSIAHQKRFLADAAHQLKTPLAGLRMQADLAQREGVSAEEFKRSLQLIGNASVRATHTVNQLLALARAEGSSSAMARMPCDLAALTVAAVQECLPHAILKSIDLGYEGAAPASPGATLDGNATLLSEMIRNLLDNAIHYTPSGADQPGIVTARVLADPFGKVVLLQVEDSGPGLAPSERELVFQPFYRVLGSGVEGSGLGLPIVREIAQLHGATITIDDMDSRRDPPGCRIVVRFTSA